MYQATNYTAQFVADAVVSECEAEHYWVNYSAMPAQVEKASAVLSD